MKKLTPLQILSRIKAIAKTPACGSESPFVCCDLVGQDELFDIQHLLATLMLDIASSIGVKQEDKLVADFPYLFKQEEQS
jgi:hypothetical protein